MLHCPRCQEEAPDHAGFCVKCGAALARLCPACGFANPLRARFCGGCGGRLNAPGAELPEPCPPAARAAPVPASAETAERRQLTVLFADLMESTALSERLDPEVLRRVIRAYQNACTVATQRFGGYLAQYLGDGVLIFFGYPVAYEDGACRAVRTALEILERVAALNQEFQAELGLELGVRLGLHTGAVVVEHLVGDRLQTPLATGETPNIAARVQALAPRNTAVLTAATYRLVAPLVQCKDIGAHELKGLARPLHLYRLQGASRVLSRWEAVSAAGLSPLVGRQSELAWLRDLWRAVLAGGPRWVLLSGEPGIGKSRLVNTLAREVQSSPPARVLEAHCSPYGQNSAFAPISDLIGCKLDLNGVDPVATRWARLEARLTQDGLPAGDLVPLLAPLFNLPVPEQHPTRDLPPAQRRHKTLEALTAWLLQAAERRPVLWVIEDLHWADPSTLELLGEILRVHGTHRLFTLLTARPEFQPPWPLGDAGHLWTVSRLGHPEAVQLVEAVAGEEALPAEVVGEIVRRTDGVPLFVEELTKMLLEQRVVESAEARTPLRGGLRQTIPATIQDSLMARLDRLGGAKTLAQWGAVLGREFRHDILEAAVGPTLPDLAGDLAQLQSAGLIGRRGAGTHAVYVFKHALVQEAAYQSLLQSTRREHHRRVGEVLERAFPDVIAAQPELLAQHYTAGGVPQAALSWWYRAGEAALARSANLEAVSHFERGLALVESLPPAAVLEPVELQFRVALGNVLMALQGYAAPEVGRHFQRARELCQRLDAQPQLSPVLSGLWSYSIVRCEFAESTALAAQMMTLARESASEDLNLEAEASAGINSFWGHARLADARVHLERAVALYDVERHRSHALLYGQDPGVIAQAHRVWVLWILGETAQAVAEVDRLRQLSRARAHAYSLGYAQAWEITLWFLARRVSEALEASAESIRYCTEQGFPLWLCVARYVHAWARTAAGQGEGAVEEIRQVLADWQATGALVSQAYQLSVLVEVQRQLGDLAGARQTLEEALARTRVCGEQWYRPELLRLRAELAFADPAATPESLHAAEADLRTGLELARASGARMWELRAAVSLARWLEEQGRLEEARPLLQHACTDFPAGCTEPEFLIATQGLTAAPVAA